MVIFIQLMIKEELSVVKQNLYVVRKTLVIMKLNVRQVAKIAGPTTKEAISLAVI